MKNSILTFFLGLLLVSPLIAQEAEQQEASHTPFSKHNVFVEALGQGIHVTFNYDFKYHFNNKLGLGFRIGYGRHILNAEFSSGNSNHHSIPLGINVLLGGGNKFFEIGVGATRASTEFLDDYRPEDWVGTLAFCYRVQPRNGGINFRIGLMPLFRIDTDKTSSDDSLFLSYWSGLSIGYTF